MDAKKINISYHKRSETRFLVFLSWLPIGVVSYSEELKAWFVNLHSVSHGTIECNTKREVDDAIREEAMKFLKDCYED